MSKLNKTNAEKVVGDIETKGFYELCFRLHNVAKIIGEECYNKNGKNNKEKLTLAQYNILQSIKYSGSECILREIAERNCISKAALSIMLKKLEVMGVVERIESDLDQDRRKSKIKLTDVGLQRIERKENEVLEVVMKLVNKNLNEEDIKYLESSFAKILEIIVKLEGQEGGTYERENK